MIIPIICENLDCANAGAEVNHISGINPPDLELFYESYDGSELLDHCSICGCLGIAEDPIFEHEWKKSIMTELL